MSEDRVGLRFISEGISNMMSDIRRYNTALTQSARTAQRAQTVTERLRLQFLSTANTIAVLDGPLGGIASRFSAFGVLLGRVGPLLAATSIAVTGLGVAFTRAARNIIETETALLSIDGALRLSGNAAGFSARQLDAMAIALEGATLTNRTEVRAAIVQLLTFERVTGDIFERTLSLSQDFVQVFGGSLESITVRIARALDDPIRNLGLLERAYGAIDPAIKAMIISLAQQGNMLAAQDLLLQQYENRIGGIAEEAAVGLAGAFDTLSGVMRTFSETFGEVIGAAPLVTAGIKALTSAIEALTGMLPRLVALLQAAALMMAVNFVVSARAASIAVRGLVASVLILRAVLLRFVPTALLIGLGEIIFRFTQMVSAAGSVGEALQGLSIIFRGMVQVARSFATNVVATIIEMAADVLQYFVDLPQRMVDAFNWAIESIATLFRNLPRMIGAAIVQAVNFVLEKIEELINKVTDRLNKLIEGLNKMPGVVIELIGPAGIGRVANAFEGALERITNFDASATIESLRDTASGLRDTADAARVAGDAMIAIGRGRFRVPDLIDEIFDPRIPTSPYDDPAGAGAGSAAEIVNLTEILAKLAEEQRRRRELIGLSEQERIQKQLYHQIVDQIGEAEAQRHAALISAFAQEYAEREMIIEQMKRQEAGAKQIENAFQSFFTSFVTGASSLRESLSNLLSQLAQMAANAAFQSLMGGMPSSGGFFATLASVLFSANGNAFSGGRVIPFANGGVVNSPTMFPMSGSNVGVMGEAGPEAIMPLRRGRDGSLGVAAQGGAQSVQVDVRVHMDEGGNWKANVEKIADKRVQRQAPGIVRQSVQATYATSAERRMN